MESNGNNGNLTHKLHDFAVSRSIEVLPIQLIHTTLPYQVLPEVLTKYQKY